MLGADRRSRGPSRAARRSPSRRLEHRGAGAVGEEDGRAPVGVVGDARQGVGPDDQDPVDARGHEAVGGDQAVDEAGAGGVEVEGAAAQPELVLHDGRGGGHGAGRAWWWPGRAGRCRRVDARRGQALRPASVASAEVVPPTRRSRMPVRSTIHASDGVHRRLELGVGERPCRAGRRPAGDHGALMVPRGRRHQGVAAPAPWWRVVRASVPVIRRCAARRSAGSR